jgi:Type II secretion system (T2SS), protein E, N-terminal domain
MEAGSGQLRRGVLAFADLANDEYLPSAAGVPGAGRSQALVPEVGFLHDALKKECSNLDCRQGRGMSWRSRRLLAFEGKLACRGACLAGVIRAAIAREGAPGRTEAGAVAHRHRVPLGLILLAQGWITHPQLQRALEAQRVQRGGKIGDLLVAECGLEEERVTRGLSVQWNRPVLTTDGFSPQSMTMVLPRFFIKDYGMLPLRVAGNRILYLGFRDRLDASLAFATERMSGLRIESGVVAEAEFEATRRRLLECAFPEAYGKAVSDSDALAARIAAVLEQRQGGASKLVRLHQHYWLRVWTPAGARAALGTAALRPEDVSDFLFSMGAQA